MTALRRHRVLTWLALAGLVYRALIPAGLMPGTAVQMQAGQVMVMCPGGMLMPADGADPAHPHAHSLAQCPFGVAAGPALPPALVVLRPPFTLAEAPLQQRPTALPLRLTRDRPPARAPPQFS